MHQRSERRTKPETKNENETNEEPDAFTQSDIFSDESKKFYRARKYAHKDDTGLVSFAQNKIASLRKICVNLRIAAGLFTNSSCDGHTFENMSKSLILCANAQELVICGCAANRIRNFFPSSEIGITTTDYELMYISRKDE